MSGPDVYADGTGDPVEDTDSNPTRYFRETPIQNDKPWDPSILRVDVTDEVAALRAALAADPHESENELAATITALRAEVDRLDRAVAYQSELVGHHDRRATKAEAKVERMRPVVEALSRARQFTQGDSGYTYAWHLLWTKHDAYRASEQETTDD